MSLGDGVGGGTLSGNTDLVLYGTAPTTNVAPQILVGATRETAVLMRWNGWKYTQVQDESCVIGSMDRLRASVGASGQRILFLTDSNGTGAGAGTGTFGLIGAQKKSFPYLLAAEFGWQTGAFFGDCNVHSLVGIENYDPRISLGSFSIDASPAGLGAHFFVCDGVSETAFEFTPEDAFDSYTVYLPTTPAASSQVGIYLDGDLIEVVSEAQASNLLVKAYTCPLGPHTVGVKNLATGVAYVSGCITEDTARKSPVLVVGAWFGAKLANLALDSAPWNCLSAAKIVDPTAVLLYCTINDITDATALTSMSASITKINYGLRSSSVINTLSFASANEANALTTLNDLGAILKANAIALGGAYVDTRLAVGGSLTFATAMGYTYDTTHLSDIGYEQITTLLRLPFYG